MLKTIIQTTIKDELQKQLGKKKNVFSLPRLTKAVINYRVNDARESQESLDAAIVEPKKPFLHLKSEKGIH
jgi:ribosomal protein L5